jgi:tetratricopeptide (TPR) repeat protein
MIFAVSTSISGKETSPPDQKKSVKVQDTNQFSHYSEGLHYKNLAAETDDPAKKRAYLESAIASFQKASEKNSNLDIVHNQLSDCYYLTGDYTRSLHHAEKSISHDKTVIDPYLRIFNINLNFKKMQDAADILNRYLSIEPLSIHVQFVLADHYLRNLNDIDKAEKGFQTVLDLSEAASSSDNYREYSHYYLGYICYMNKQYDLSIYHFKKVLQINSTNNNAVNTLALLYMELNNLTEAEKYADISIKNDYSNKKIHGVLGRIYYIKNDNRCEDHLKAAMNSDGIDSLIARALYFEKIGYLSASSKILAAVKKNNKTLITPYIASGKILSAKNSFISAAGEFSRAGALLYEAGQYPEAVYYLSRSAAMNPAIESYYYLARSYEDSGSLSLAIVYYKKVNEIEPSSDVLLQIALLNGLKMRYTEAFNIISKITISEPDNSKAYFIAGILYFKQEDYINAEKYFSTAISIYEEVELYHYYMAAIYEKTGRIDDAIESLKSAIKYNPESGRSYNFLGYLYADNNIHLDDSYSLIKKALKLEPDNGAYIDSLGWIYFRKGDYQKALEKLLEAEKVMSEAGYVDPAVYDHLGDAYEKLGNSKMAMIYWNKSNALEENPKIQEKINKHEKN